MPLLQFLIVLIVLGVVLWAINNYIPMDGAIKKILNVVIVIIAVLFVLNTFGLLDAVRGFNIRVGR